MDSAGGGGFWLAAWKLSPRDPARPTLGFHPRGRDTHPHKHADVDTPSSIIPKSLNVGLTHRPDAWLSSTRSVHASEDDLAIKGRTRGAARTGLQHTTRCGTATRAQALSHQGPEQARPHGQRQTCAFLALLTNMALRRATGQNIKPQTRRLHKKTRGYLLKLGEGGKGT